VCYDIAETGVVVPKINIGRKVTPAVGIVMAREQQIANRLVTQR